MYNDGRQCKNSRTGQAKSAPTTPHIEQRLTIVKHPSLEKDVMAILQRSSALVGPRPNTIDATTFHGHLGGHSSISKTKHRSFSNTNRNALKSVSRSTPAIVNQGLLDSKDVFSHLPRSTKKFHKHFPEVNIGRGVLNYYVCAYVADILHQGTLFITEKYFAFYSNIFGFVNKILIPITEVAAIKKKKTASFIPNAIGILTDEGKMYVFSSLISRENTYKFMDHMWRKSRKLLDSDSDPAIVVQQEMNGEESNVEDSGSGSADSILEEESENEFEVRSTTASALKLREVRKSFEENSIKQREKVKLEKKNYISDDIKLPSRASKEAGSYSVTGNMAMPIQYLNNGLENSTSTNLLLWSSTIAVIVLVLSATYMLYRVQILTRQINGEDPINYNTVYEEVLCMQQKLHSGTAEEVEKTLGTQLKHISAIRQSLEALSYLFNTDISTRAKFQENIINA